MRIRLLAILVTMFLSSTAFAAVTVYSGVDAGAGPADPRPNSDAARADFEADIPNWALLNLDFEALPLNTQSGPIGGGVTLTSFNIDGTGGVNNGGNNVLGYNTTSAGSQFLQFKVDEFGGTGYMMFSFDVPIQAFGAYFTGLGTVAAVITLDFNDGSAQSIDLNGASNGGAAFYGFTDPGKFITQVTINEVNSESSRDIFGMDDLIVVQTDDVARFHVTKTFSDDNDAEVDVTLTCNSGLPLEQDFTITGGDPEGVTFTVTELASYLSVDCEVTESGGPEGYTTVMNDGEGCSWEGIGGWLYTCEITNEAKPATYTVVKDWVIEGDGGLAVDAEAEVTITCDSEIDGGWKHHDEWHLKGTLGDGDKLVATVDVMEGPANCSAREKIHQSGVESMSSGCDGTELSAGGSATCTFTNTVFYEGVPTLSQYGLAILVLLTLGVGLVGFRRFA